MDTVFQLAIPAVGILFLVGMAIYVMTILRRVVPTNMVHIVQSAKSTTSYGKGQDAGNVYYAWPSWLPRLGVSVLEFPESVFAVTLKDYDAYDQARLPFLVDVTAFFRVSASTVAAQRVANFRELETHLLAILQGSVRRILSTNVLERIMEARSELGEQFTNEVKTQIQEWGVTTVKNIEFMDIRDSSGSKVIHNIMAKEQSRIDRESRVAVAENKMTAESAEIDNQRKVEVQRQDAEQQVGLRTAQKDKEVGIANELANQEIQEQARTTAEKEMQVEAVRREREAEISRNVAVTTADGAREAAIHAADARLAETVKEAEGIAAKGTAEAAAKEKLLMAPVTAQIALAKEIGDNPGYMTYLVTLEQVTAGKTVGVEMSKALAESDLKVISTGGGENIQGGVAKLTDMFTPAGGTSLTGMLAALGSTTEGAALIKRFTGGMVGGAVGAEIAGSAENVSE